MTFGELTSYVLEMSGIIPEDTDVIMETHCCDEMGAIWWQIDHVRFHNDNVIFSDEKE